MTGDQATAPLIGGVDLLERSLSYTLGSLRLVTPAAMTAPTPCAEWDLRALLAHMDDSLAALHEAAEIGEVAVTPVTLVTPVTPRRYGDREADPVARLRERGCALLGGWTRATGDGPVSVAGAPLSNPLVTSTGAVEITVHGWDVAQACGQARRIPVALAEALLPLAALLVTEADRPTRFAAPVPVAPAADADVRLLAFLGRSTASA